MNSPLEQSQVEINLPAYFQKASVSELQFFFDPFPIGIVIHAENGDVIYLNGAAKTLFRLETCSYVTLTTFARLCRLKVAGTGEQYPTERLPAAQALAGKTASSKNIEIFDHFRRIALQSQAMPMRDAAGHITHALVAYHSVAETGILATHLGSQSQGAANPRKLSLAPRSHVLTYPWPDPAWMARSQVNWWTDDIPGTIFLLDVGADGEVRCEYINRPAEIIFEAPRQDLMRAPGQYFWSQMHPHDRKGFLIAIAQQTDSDQLFSYEWCSVAPSGRARWLEVQARPQFEESGAVRWQGVLLDISDRKAAELSRQHREHELYRIIQALPDLMFRVSHEGYWLGYVHTNRVIDCLPADYDPTGRHISDHMPPEIAQLQMQSIRQAIATGEIQIFEQTLTISDRVQHEEIRVVPQGQTEVLFIVRNITDRKQVELALKQREAENQAILSGIPDLIFRLSRDGTYLSYSKNQITKDLLEKHGDPIGTNITEYATSEFYESHIATQLEYVHQVLETGEMMLYEQHVPIEDRWHFEEVRIIPTGTDEVMFIIQNIDDRKAAQAALQQSEAQKQAILKAIPDLMLRLRHDGVILDYMGGTNFVDLLEDGEGCIGQNLLAYASTARLKAHVHRKMTAMRQALDTGEIQIYEQESQLEQTRQQEEVRVVPITSEEVLVMIRDISDYKRIEAELRAVNEQLEELSLTDSLTMLANRRRFDEHLQREWQRAQREQTPISLILFDLDYFKRFNDTYGHPQGDSCLYQVAQAALRVVHRASDLVARYGGEEFAVILSDTHLRGAFVIAQKVCEAIRALQIPHVSSEVASVLTASLGVSCIIPTPQSQPNVLIRQADQALYAAKQAGRNNCQCFVVR
ncbi:MAG: diguanylate cyclase domain-containing protein [Leptolyngbyaceae cyanobacterium]